jgi:hypothetical protein
MLHIKIRIFADDAGGFYVGGAYNLRC